MKIKITMNDKGNPPGKLADAELHFDAADMVPGLAGLKLIGFSIWERRTGGKNVTFPARQYSVNGERRSFALLRPIVDTTAQDTIRNLVIEAYQEAHSQADPHCSCNDCLADADAKRYNAIRARNAGQAPTPAPTPVYTGQIPTTPALAGLDAIRQETTDHARQAEVAAGHDEPEPATLPRALDDPRTPQANIAPSALEYQTKARAMFHNMTETERHGIAFGLFPAAPMESARLEGYADNRRLAVALMDAARPVDARPADLDPTPADLTTRANEPAPAYEPAPVAAWSSNRLEVDQEIDRRPLHMQNVPPKRKIIF